MPKDSRKKNCGCSRYRDCSRNKDDRCRRTRHENKLCDCKPKIEDRCDCCTIYDKSGSDDDATFGHSSDDNDKNIQNIVITIKHC